MRENILCFPHIHTLYIYATSSAYSSSSRRTFRRSVTEFRHHRENFIWPGRASRGHNERCLLNQRTHARMQASSYYTKQRGRRSLAHGKCPSNSHGHDPILSMGPLLLDRATCRQRLSVCSSGRIARITWMRPIATDVARSVVCVFGTPQALYIC